MVKTGIFYIELYMSISTREKYSHPVQVFLDETAYVNLYVKP